MNQTIRHNIFKPLFLPCHFNILTDSDNAWLIKLNYSLHLANGLLQFIMLEKKTPLISFIPLDKSGFLYPRS